jgi:hypothetical protein
MMRFDYKWQVHKGGGETLAEQQKLRFFVNTERILKWHLKYRRNNCNCMQQNPPSYANSHSAGQEISGLSWNSKVRYRTLKRSVMDRARWIQSSPSHHASFRYTATSQSHHSPGSQIHVLTLAPAFIRSHKYPIKSTNCEASHYATRYTSLPTSNNSSQVQIFFSVPCSQRQSVSCLSIRGQY